MAVSAPTVSKVVKLRRQSTIGKMWGRFLTNKASVAALIFILLEILMAIFAPFIAPYDPIKHTDYSCTYQPPSAKYWFGCDDMGRDQLSRIIYGARVSYAVGILSQVTVVLIGLPIGALAGLVGGWFDYALMRIIDVLSSVPTLLLYILLMIALGSGLPNLIIAMSITGWIGISRLVRGQVLSLKQTDYVRAARAMGANTAKIVTTHLVRNSLTPIIVTMAFGVPGAMFGEAGLSYLGLGIAPPTPSWGQMVGLYQVYFLSFPHLLLIPSLVLSLTMFAWIVFGDGIQYALDPTVRI